METRELHCTLLAGYQPLDQPWDDDQAMQLSSSDESQFSSDLDSASDLEGSSSPVASSMTDSLDLHPLLGPSEHAPPTSDVTTNSNSSLSRHVTSWVMRAQQDDSNANTLAPMIKTAMPRLQAVLTADSPISPAIEKAEIERSEKLVEVNGNLVVNLCKDGVRPKTVLQTLKTSRHTAGGNNSSGGGITRSPKQRRSTTETEPRRELNQSRDPPRVHFSNDACVPRKQEKMMMNSSLKLGLESPSRRPSRPTSLPVASRQLTPRQRQTSESSAARHELARVVPVGGSSVDPADGSTHAAPSAECAAVASVKRRERTARREEKLQHRKSCPVGPEKEERACSPDGYSGYDVYNLETTLPKIDWDAIESHLKTVREEERRRRNDREAIRRKLAMGGEMGEEGVGSGPLSLAAGAPPRKPSLQSRLQAGMNLQICFMNETASDEEDEDEFSTGSGLLARRCSGAAAQPEPAQFQSLPVDLNDWPKFSQPPAPARASGSPLRTSDFVRHQAQLQAEARLALSQAPQMARMQMEIERQSRKSPISDVVRVAFQKIGVPFPDGRRRVSRQLLTEMNIAQLQVIVNDFHARIEGLNEALVRYLMERDEQHMEQDSKLVHIEDLTSYFGQKHAEASPQSSSSPAPQSAAAEAKRVSRGSLRLARAK